MQQITSTGTEETISIYNASSVPIKQVFRGGVKIQSGIPKLREHKHKEPSTFDAELPLPLLNKQPVWVGGKLYENGQQYFTNSIRCTWYCCKCHMTYFLDITGLKKPKRLPDT